MLIVIGQLTNWSKERGETGKSECHGADCARPDQPQIKAVAAYLSYLE